MLTSITGINWGDEGKGRMVDLLSQDYDIVARYQGGDNAGHTVKTERGKFVLNRSPPAFCAPTLSALWAAAWSSTPSTSRRKSPP